MKSTRADKRKGRRQRAFNPPTRGGLSRCRAYPFAWTTPPSTTPPFRTPAGPGCRVIRRPTLPESIELMITVMSGQGCVKHRRSSSQAKCKTTPSPTPVKKECERTASMQKTGIAAIRPRRPPGPGPPPPDPATTVGSGSHRPYAARIQPHGSGSDAPSRSKNRRILLALPTEAIYALFRPHDRMGCPTRGGGHGEPGRIGSAHGPRAGIRREVHRRIPARARVRVPALRDIPGRRTDHPPGRVGGTV